MASSYKDQPIMIVGGDVTYIDFGETQVIKSFLESIIPVIENIDSGCPGCIAAFCTDVNEKILKKGLKLKYNEAYPVKVIVEYTEMKLP